MHFRNFAVALVALAATTLAISAPVQAQGEKPMAGFVGFQGSPDADFTFSGGIGGTLVTQPGGTQIIAAGPDVVTSFSGPAYLVFGPITQTGAAVVDGITGEISAEFSAGSFSINTLPFGAGDVLLTGDFGGTLFTSASGDAAGLQNNKLVFSEVTYHTGFYVDDFIAKYGSLGPGSFSLSFTSIEPDISLTGGGINAFSANNSSGVFSATTAVPEPGEYAVMGMAGLTVCGLMVRARRRRSANGMAS
jgi:hypothetical protein